MRLVTQTAAPIFILYLIEMFAIVVLLHYCTHNCVVNRPVT